MKAAKVLAKGQVVIPKEIRDKVRLAPGDRVEVRMTKDGVLLVPLRKTKTELYRGSVKGKLSLEDLERLYSEKP